MDEGFRSMQEEAMRRVMEMQRRAQSYTEPPPPEPEKPPAADLLSELVGIGLDEEKALLGLLIYILYKNGADMKLLLGLGYLLL